MSSTSSVADTYDDVLYQGKLLLTGNRKTPLLNALGGLTGTVKTVAAQQYAMGAGYSLDAGAQNVSTETALMSTGTAKFYALSQEYNVCQAMTKYFAVSDLREVTPQQIDATNISISGGVDPGVLTPFDRAMAGAMAQLALDIEFSLIQGTYVARSAVGTSVATGGLTDSTVGISTNTTNAASGDLTVKMINSLLATMAGNGAEMSRLAFICPYVYVPEFSRLYGNQPMDWNMGGVAVKNVMTDFGNIGVIGTAQCPANTVIIADLDYLGLVFVPNVDGSLVRMHEYDIGAASRNGFLECFVGADFGRESYHAKITSLATPS